MYTLLFLSLASADDGSIEIVVESSAQDQTTGGAATVIEVDERLAASADLGQALQGSAGATIVRLGGLRDWSGVSLRGSSFRQVQVHLDGVALNPDGSDSVNLAELPLHAFSRIEVYRGAAPPQLAAAPIGGVVNLVTADEAAPQLRVTVGSLGTTQLSATGGTPHWLLFAEAFRSEGDFIHFVDNGTVYNLSDDALRPRGNNEKSQLTTLARYRASFGAWELTALDAFLARDEGLPGRATTPSSYATLSTQRNLLVLRGRRVGESSSLELRAWDLRRQELLLDPMNEVGVGNQRAGLTSSTGLLLHGSWLLVPWLVPSATLGYRRDRYSVEDRVSGLTQGPALRNGWSATGSAALWFWEERIEVAPVLHAQLLDNRSLGDRPFDVGPVSPDSEPLILSLSPRGTLALRPIEGLLLRASAGRYLRPPDFTELFGDRGALHGNPDLVPETGLHADLGVRASRGPLTLDAALFHVRSEHLIVMVQNSQATMVPVNLDGALARGVELGGELQARDLLDARVAWTLSDTHVLSEDPSMDGNPLPRVPARQLNVAASVHWEERARLGWTWSHSDQTTFDRTAFYWSAPRSLHTVFLRVQPQPHWPSFEVGVLNAADTLVEVVDRNPLDPEGGGRAVVSVTDFNGYPLPGRTVLFTITWSPS